MAALEIVENRIDLAYRAGDAEALRRLWTIRAALEGGSPGAPDALREAVDFLVLSSKPSAGLEVVLEALIVSQAGRPILPELAAELQLARRKRPGA